MKADVLLMVRAFYIIGIALFVNFLTIFFTMPETAYWGPRPEITISRPKSTEALAVSETSEKDQSQTVSVSADQPIDEKTTVAEPTSGAAVEVGQALEHIPKRPYIRELHPFPIVNQTASLRKLFLRPIVLAA